MFGLSKKERRQKEREDRIFQVYARLAVDRLGELERRENQVRLEFTGQEAAERLSWARQGFEGGLRMVAYHEALRIVAQAERGLICAKNQGDFGIFEDKDGGR